jgi:hypothetical protein
MTKLIEANDSIVAKAEATEIWTKAMWEVFYCVPHEVREDVLQAMLQQELDRRKEPMFVLQSIDQIFARREELFKYYHEQREAISLIIQCLVRKITNNDSKEGAAKTLYREHRHGTGSGWLPHYLDGLPGLKVDIKRCAAISDQNGKSELKFFFEPQVDDGAPLAVLDAGDDLDLPPPRGTVR